MRKIVIQQNVFLNEAKIVPVFCIMQPDKQWVSKILGKSIHFTGMELTRKTVFGRKYLLVSTKSNLYCVQREVDNLLARCYKRNQIYNNQTETPGRRKKSLIHNHFTAYAEVCQPTQYSPLSYHRVGTISFTTNNDSNKDF